MAVYVDDMRRTATVRGLRRRWSHLIADNPDELRAFAARLGLSRSWLQKVGTAAEHFDVTDSVRDKAITLGAERISYLDLPFVMSRRAGSTSSAQEY